MAKKPHNYKHFKELVDELNGSEESDLNLIKLDDLKKQLEILRKEAKLIHNK